jgi:hypothetical protein
MDGLIHGIYAAIGKQADLFPDPGRHIPVGIVIRGLGQDQNAYPSAQKAHYQSFI